jgi:hypothetical protein
MAFASLSEYLSEFVEATARRSAGVKHRASDIAEQKLQLSPDGFYFRLSRGEICFLCAKMLTLLNQ